MTPPWGLPALCRGGVAQNWLKQALYKGQVVGSSPTAPTVAYNDGGETLRRMIAALQNAAVAGQRKPVFRIG